DGQDRSERLIDDEAARAFRADPAVRKKRFGMFGAVVAVPRTLFNFSLGGRNGFAHFLRDQSGIPRKLVTKLASGLSHQGSSFGKRRSSPRLERQLCSR